jgi:hypothetical protein
MPKSQQSKAKRALQEIWMAETKKDALAAFRKLIDTAFFTAFFGHGFRSRPDHT